MLIDCVDGFNAVIKLLLDGHSNVVGNQPAHDLMRLIYGAIHTSADQNEGNGDVDLHSSDWVQKLNQTCMNECSHSSLF